MQRPFNEPLSRADDVVLVKTKELLTYFMEMEDVDFNKGRLKAEQV